MQSPPGENSSSQIVPLSYANEGTHFATLTDLAVVLIRICAVVTWLQCIPYVYYWTSIVRDRSLWNRVDITSYIVTPLVLLSAGATLYFFAPPLSRLFAPPRALPVVKSARMLTGFRRIAFATTGLVLFAQALPDLVSVLLRYFWPDKSDVRFRDPASGQLLIYCGVRLAIAIWLIIGNSGLRRLWNRARSPNLR